MKHIIEDFSEKTASSALWDFYFKGLKVGVLDIETTGLNPARNKFVLGCLYDCSQGKLHQILAAGRAEEQEALEEYLKVISQVDMLVTYNGKHFDLPFIEKRYQGKARLPYNLDLYLLVNGHSQIKKLVPNLKQKTLENYMGLWTSRADEISGADSVDLFNHYEATGDPEAERKILLHNNDDVRQLTRLTKVIQKCDMHKAMYTMGFPEGPYRVDKIRIGSSFVEVTGRQTVTDYVSYAGGRAEFDSWKGIFNLQIPLIRTGGMAIVDLEAAGVSSSELEKYPACESGLLIIEKQSQPLYRELNHFIKLLLRKYRGN